VEKLPKIAVRLEDRGTAPTLYALFSLDDKTVEQRCEKKNGQNLTDLQHDRAQNHTSASDHTDTKSPCCSCANRGVGVISRDRHLILANPIAYMNSLQHRYEFRSSITLHNIHSGLFGPGWFEPFRRVSRFRLCNAINSSGIPIWCSAGTGDAWSALPVEGYR
jgi:hypothetical protein